MTANFRRANLKQDSSLAAKAECRRSMGSSVHIDFLTQNLISVSEFVMHQLLPLKRNCA